MDLAQRCRKVITISKLSMTSLTWVCMYRRDVSRGQAWNFRRIETCILLAIVFSQLVPKLYKLSDQLRLSPVHQCDSGRVTKVALIR